MNEHNDFKPFIPANRVIPELTVTSIILGVLLAILFGGANAYLGLRVGMTVSASIPAAVISMGIIRIILKKDSILENNMVQTIGSAGESLAAGAIFTMPALFMWAKEWNTSTPSFWTITLIAFCGGILGIIFMIPLRNALIVKEHGVLPYPEGTACAEVLLTGEESSSKSSLVFIGMGVSAIYKFITDGLHIFPSEVDWKIKSYKGSGFGIDVLPALLGVGYICGIKIAACMVAGGAIAWFVFMPLISLFGADVTLFPATVPVADLDTWGIWKNYIRYIGAGTVAGGGIISLIKSLPLIFNTFKSGVRGYKFRDGNNSDSRTNVNLPISFVWIGIVVIILLMWLIPIIPVNFLGAVVIVVFGFFFATVSSRMVGLVGSSNNPVSGMTIATLLIATIILKASGNVGKSGMIAAITIGSVICIVSAMAGDTSQDLKTGYILGATPKKQQIGEIIGSIASALTIGGVLYLLNKAWGFGSEQLSAPQATLMKMVVEGVMGGNLPWTLVFIGVATAVIIEILGVPVLPFAVGLYLPIHLTTPILAGGLVRWTVEKYQIKKMENNKEFIEKGVLYTSGMIAGEGLIGILLAIFALIKVNNNYTVGEWINLAARFGINLGNAGGIVAFSLLIISLFVTIIKK